MNPEKKVVEKLLCGVRKNKERMAGLGKMPFYRINKNHIRGFQLKLFKITLFGVQKMGRRKTSTFLCLFLERLTSRLEEIFFEQTFSISQIKKWEGVKQALFV